MKIDDLRLIPGYAHYFCGSDGTVWSMKRNKLKQMQVFPRSKCCCYLSVNLCARGKFKLFSVHRLIAIAWIGPPPSGRHIVLHSDDNPANNSAPNLRWGLPIDNSSEMVSRGRQAQGEMAGNSKLSASEVTRIRKLFGHQSQRSIAKEFRVTTSTISSIFKRDTWRSIV